MSERIEPPQPYVLTAPNLPDGWQDTDVTGSSGNFEICRPLGLITIGSENDPHGFLSNIVFLLSRKDQTSPSCPTRTIYTLAPKYYLDGQPYVGYPSPASISFRRLNPEEYVPHYIGTLWYELRLVEVDDLGPEAGKTILIDLPCTTGPNPLTVITTQLVPIFEADFEANPLIIDQALDKTIAKNQLL